MGVGIGGGVPFAVALACAARGVGAGGHCPLSQRWNVWRVRPAIGSYPASMDPRAGTATWYVLR